MQPAEVSPPLPAVTHNVLAKTFVMVTLRPMAATHATQSYEEGTMSKYAQYETEMRSVADTCGSLYDAHQEAETFARRIDSDLRAFERENRRTTMEKRYMTEERERLRGLATQIKNRPQKGPFADEFLDKLDDALQSNRG